MSSFWPSQRVFVTGGHGFLGSHLVPRLAAAGATVVAPAHADVDLLDAAATRAALVAARPTLIMHLAASRNPINFNILHQLLGSAKGHEHSFGGGVEKCELRIYSAM